MALSTYDELQTDIADWLNRNDVDLIAAIPSFIRLAEIRINERLRIPIMEKTITLNSVAGVETVDLPTDFLELRALYLDQNSDFTLAGKTISSLVSAFPIDTNGKPAAFAISGSKLFLRPVPSSILDFVMTYFASVDALSDTNQTNSILTQKPNIYLYGALLESAPFLQDDGRVQTWAKLLDAGFADAESAADRQLWSSPNLSVQVDLT